jgi:adenylosuccinate lyase
VRAAAGVGLENVPLWHERDISHSSAERIVVPDAFLALDYMLERFTWIVDGLVVHADRMERNLWASHGLFFSHRLLLALVEHGLERTDAYRLVQRNAMRAWDEERDFEELVRADREVTAQLDDAALTDVFDLHATVANLDRTFDRLRRLVPKEEPVHV